MHPPGDEQDNIGHRAHLLKKPAVAIRPFLHPAAIGMHDSHHHLAPQLVLQLLGQ